MLGRAQSLRSQEKFAAARDDFSAILELSPKSAEQRILQPLRDVTLEFWELTAATASAKNELQKFTSATLDSRLASISAQLELCVSVLKAIGKSGPSR